MACLALAGCGSGTRLITHKPNVVTVQAPAAIAGPQHSRDRHQEHDPRRRRDPVADAAGVALAVYPSSAPGTHPDAVVIAPTDDWQAALAASVLMAPPIRAPTAPVRQRQPALADLRRAQAPRADRVGRGRRSAGDPGRRRARSRAGTAASAIAGADPYTLSAAIDRFYNAAHGASAATSVVIAPGNNAAYAMPAAGWAAESGDPILFVNGSTVPAPTAQALLAHQKPHIYVLAPSSVIPDSVLTQLKKYGTVKRISAPDPVTNSVTFAEYRDPPCPYGQPCAHVPGSFGWAMRSPGHGYVLINANRPLDAAAAAPLSASGSYGPQLLVDNPSTLPTPVLNFFLNYATPGYTQEGPTAAVYNHGWLIGDQTAISVAVQAQVDSLLEAVPQK